MVRLIFVIVALIGATYVDGAIDWCQMKTQYCGGQEHIACEPNSFPMGTDVRNIKLVTMTPEIIKVGVDRHNYHRSNIAAGRVAGIPSATAMEKMSWHTDLQYVATAHAKHGNFKHDSCRYFTEFPMSGQNLAVKYSSVAFTNPAQEFQSMIDLWYNEMPIVRDQMPSCINSFTSNPNCLDAGHFTVMVNDVNRAVGCALVTFEKLMSNTWWYSIMATCNYAGNNVMNRKIFATGASCSACAGVGKTCEASTNLCI